MKPSCTVTMLTEAVGSPAAVPVEVPGAADARREVGQRAGRGAPEIAHRVAVLAVPLAPPGRELPDVVGAPISHGSAISFTRREHRVLADRLQERGMRVKVARPAPEAGREVEAKAVHVHLLHPVAQRVHHQTQRLREMQIHGVAAAGVIDVAGAVSCSR